MLIAFEGQDGSGKTALLRATYTELTQQGIPAITVEEFSDSLYGHLLLDALSRDKFLRPVIGESATKLTRALEIVADLYYLDERVIAPALEAGYVVLKDRHLDTIFYTLVPALVQDGTVRSESRMLTWLAGMVSELRHRPTITVYVDTPLDVRLNRIGRRHRHVQEDRARHVSDEDLAVFAARERIVRQLIAAEPTRFLTIDNNRPLPEGVSAVLGQIHSWRSGVS